MKCYRSLGTSLPGDVAEARLIRFWTQSLDVDCNVEPWFESDVYSLTGINETLESQLCYMLLRFSEGKP